jgi:hypothetical protein
MVHQGQRLPLGLKPRDDLSRVHSRFDDFQRNHSTDWLFLRSHEDLAEAAAPDGLQ